MIDVAALRNALSVYAERVAEWHMAGNMGHPKLPSLSVGPDGAYSITIPALLNSHAVLQYRVHS